MKLKKVLVGLLAIVAVAATAGWFSLHKDARAVVATMPTNRDLLFWSQPQRDAAFRALDRLPLLAKVRDIPAGSTPLPLPPGPPLKLPLDVDAYMAGQRSAALLVLHDGRLRLERYGLGFDASGRWTSFSVAKSMTSTLVGAALRDGHIRSMDDKVSDYIPAMKGSAYDAVSIRQLLTMTSGVQWNEDYADPKSDVALFNKHEPEPGVDALVSYLRRLPRAAPPGERWLYSTGETNLVGILVSQATKRPLADYLSEKVWKPAGMEQQATWILNKTGQEISGCCVQAAARDFVRYGQFILNGARVNGQAIVPDGWLAEATSERTGIGQPGRGYGYQWWTYADGTFAARGIFGQGLFIDPKRKLVIASNANWAGGARDRTASAAREDFYRAVQRAVDEETGGGVATGAAASAAK
ncbi:serine hydrolase domain-containing protein [Aquabacterium humicola]|uniref:serine hydrolase domain-containing protein n=1 Tax=Aquabacterium humicola TaxID=3237377 RepID=UPI00254317F5|nr:serine hydrolase [Rubrivivax pictus]